jgi:tripartite-type tricarboxylate transporter receptor subunit TctC
MSASLLKHLKHRFAATSAIVANDVTNEAPARPCGFTSPIIRRPKMPGMIPPTHLFPQTRVLLAAVLMMTGAISVPSALAQDYPSKKPVTIVVGFAPGGAADQLARIFGQRLSASLAQSFVIENRAGAGGTTGAATVAKAAPDGYTLLMGVTASQSIAPSMYPSLRYQPEKDFQPISLIAHIPLAFVVHPEVKANAPKEFVALAKARTESFSFASSGIGAIPHLTGELFELATGVKMTHVPYKGAAPAMTDLVSGRVDVMFDHLPSVLPHIRTGKLRALAIAGRQRASALPQLPTLAELGVPGVEVSSWFGLLAPAGTPEAIVQRLQAEVSTILASEDVKVQLRAIGAEPVGSTAKEFANVIQADSKKWADLIKAAGITAE